MTVLVEFRNVTKIFGKKKLIENVSFTIKSHDLTTLIGPNGAGKTTIAKLILGLEQPSSGQIIIDPHLKIGYLPQRVNFEYNLPITAEKFLSLLAPATRAQNSADLISFTDFDNIKHKDITELSGGQFQKLLLSSVLLDNPDFIIFDEPTQSLDLSSQQEFYKLVEQIRNINITIFMISHDLFTVMKNSDQVICLNGHICCSGKPGDLTQNQNFVEALSALGFYIHHHDHKH